METFYKVLGIVAASLIIWLLYRNIKGNPETFSKENFSKSFSTMGILAIVLIGFIALCIMLLRTG
jgi:hypothetical protein